jgi:EmrB/QacA subfamily drug resistance transporter
VPAPCRDAQPKVRCTETLALDSPRGRWVLAVTILGSTVVILDGTVVNVALPAIAKGLSADVAGLQWVLSGYLLTLASLLLLAGELGDRYGRRRVFVAGVVWFGLASALCAIASSVEMLIAARVLQGIGGALLTPGSLAILEVVIRPEDRARAIGAWSGATGIGAAIGPLAGGGIVDAVGWRWIFVVNVPLAAFVAWAATRHVPETTAPPAVGRLDVSGAALATVGLAGVTYALIAAPDHAGAVVLVPAIAGAVALVALIAVERRAVSPMLPLDLFTHRRFAGANIVTFVVYAGLGGVFFLLVVLLQVALGYSPIEAGAATLPVTAMMLLLSSRTGALAQRIGPRLPLTVGPFVIAAGMLLMRTIGPGDDYITGVLPSQVVFGLGLAITVAPVTATALSAAGDDRAGTASAVNNAVARTAQLLALAVLPALAGLSGNDIRVASALEAGFDRALLISAGLSAAGGVLAALMIRGPLQPAD